MYLTSYLTRQMKQQSTPGFEAFKLEISLQTPRLKLLFLTLVAWRIVVSEH